MSQEQQYYIVINEQSSGPFTLEQIRAFPTLTPDTLVWKPGYDNWVAARTIPEIFDFNNPPAPAFEEEPQNFEPESPLSDEPLPPMEDTSLNFRDERPSHHEPYMPREEHQHREHHDHNRQGYQDDPRLNPFARQSQHNEQPYQQNPYGNQRYNQGNYPNQGYNQGNQGYQQPNYPNQGYNQGNQGYQQPNYPNQGYNQEYNQGNQGYNQPNYPNQGYNQGYGQPPYGPGPYRNENEIPHTNWVPWAIVTIVAGVFTNCISLILGIIAVVQANKANKFYEQGMGALGDSSNSSAKVLSIIGLVLAGIVILIYLFFWNAIGAYFNAFYW